METLTNFVWFVVEVIMWMLLIHTAVSLISAYLDYKKIKGQATEAREELKERVAKMVHYISQEKHGEVYYWFDGETDQFLGQGRTEAEIKQHLLERFKGHVFIINDERALAGPTLEAVPIEKLKLSSDLRTIQ